MPLWNKSRANGRSDYSDQDYRSGKENHYDTVGGGQAEEHQQEPHQEQDGRPRLLFHCQLAQGSPTGIISGFTNVKELYKKIAECYDMVPSDILFCTLNTHKVDMSHLLGGQIGLDDFIFAHRKGDRKEIEIIKTEDALGLTITDNGAGYAFIKRIKDGSTISRNEYIEVGDHIEKIDGESLVGCRHYEVAKMLKEIPKGSTFTIRLIAPQKAGFCAIGPRSGPGAGKKAGYGSGKQTLRLKANGTAAIEDVDNSRTLAEENINKLLETFMGINDSELASQIYDLAEDKTNTMELAEAIDNSDLEAFGFTDDFIFELWGAITDAKSGRAKTINNNNF